MFILSNEGMHMTEDVLLKEIIENVYISDLEQFKGNIKPFTHKSAKFKTDEKLLNFILKNCQKQTVTPSTTVPRSSIIIR